MTSAIVKRSVVIGGKKTSISLEEAFWNALKEIAHEARTTISETVAKINAERNGGNLSSHIRLFVLDHFRQRCDAGNSL
jgi:predicted DNA-binding ribbon-helix-helix protein